MSKIRYKPDDYAEELHLGLTGPRVGALQGILNKVVPEGAPLTVDGQFGPATEERVRLYQTRMKLDPVNGIATPQEFTAAAETVGIPLHRVFYLASCRNVILPSAIPTGEKSTVIVERMAGLEIANPEVVDLTIPRRDLPPLARLRKGVPLASPAARKGIVIHHSATPMDAKGSNPWGFASSHVLERHFPSIAYHMVVMPKGPLYKCLMPDEKGWHAGSRDFPGDENEMYYGICFPGDFSAETMTDTHYHLGVQALLWWIRYHRVYSRDTFWAPTFLRHSDLVRKDCPGKNFPFEQMVTDVNLMLRGGQ